MLVALTGGGTGGHVIPNMAVIAELKKHKGVDILYIGSKSGIERNMMTKIGVRYRGIPSGKLRRYFSWQNFVDPFKVIAGIFRARDLLKQFKPNVVFSKGGFVSLPVVLAAYRQKIPVVMHESDVSPGLSNRIAMRFSHKICISFEETRKFIPEKILRKKDVILTGNPVREEILEGNKHNGFKFAGLNSTGKPVLLVIGGSQGAMQINDLIKECLPVLIKHFQIIHIAGPGNLSEVSGGGDGKNVLPKGYVQFEYIDDELPDIYAISDLVVTRGGANTLAEIAMLKKNAIVIPLPTRGSRGDQIENAKAFAKRFGWPVLSGAISSKDFLNAIEATLENKKLQTVEFVNGTRKIVDVLLGQG